jgi:hypothetical protein
MTPLSYLDIRFTVTVSGQAPDLPFLGPTVRGLLGYGLRDRCCGHAADEAGRCSLGEACTYAYLFEAPVQRRVASAVDELDALPQPFIPLVDPPAAARAPERQLRFGIRLLGDATALAPQVVDAVFSREPCGFGARSTGFRVEELGLGGLTAWRRVAGGGADEAAEAVRTRMVSATQRPDPLPLSAGDTTLLFRFRAPVSLCRSAPDRRAWAAQILDAAARRRWLLESAYGAMGAPPPLPREVDVSGFSTEWESVRPFSFARRSTRHGRTVRLSGLVGELAIRGPWARHAVLLTDAVSCGIGRSCSFGFGLIEIEPAHEMQRLHQAPDRATNPVLRSSSRADRLNKPRWLRLRGAPPAKRVPLD